MTTEQTQVHITNFRPFAKGTLLAFFDVELSSGLIIRDCSLHSKGLARWIHTPSTKFTTKDGKATYKRLVDFTSREIADRFREVVLEALDRMHGETNESVSPPATVSADPPAQKTNASGPPRAEIPGWLKP